MMALMDNPVRAAAAASLDPETISWQGGIDGHASLIDQTRLPARFERIAVETPDAMAEAIRRLAVRGAPAIGVAAAYGICLGARGLRDRPAIEAGVARACRLLEQARPTAVNLEHMVARMRRTAEASAQLAPLELRVALLNEARAIHDEDRALCRGIGRAGAPLVRDGMRVLTHCNAGALATAGLGTALAVLYEAARQGKRFEVVAGETRPLLQGARLTAWELERAGIPVTLICDSAAGRYFAGNEIDLVITGADRIAANGDTANKIGTYTVACLAHAHGVPFYVAAPATTFDFTLEDGTAIPIEERDASEVWRIAADTPPPPGLRIRNPAFDVTPGLWIRGWITDRGVLTPPFTELRGAP